MQEIIKVEGICKSYNGKQVLKDLCITVEKGEIYGILGANGAGKSTSIECILTTRQKDKGTISIMGMDPEKNRKKLFEKIGVQFQDSNYQREIRVDEICEETTALYKDVNDWKELLCRFGIRNKEKSMVKDLSGGERQRLFVILALISKPEIVFLDEVTTGLDARARREVWKILKSLKEVGITIVLTSHFMDEIEALCDEIVILKKGETVFHGTVAEAKEKSACNKFEDAYLYFSDDEKEELFDENI